MKLKEKSQTKCEPGARAHLEAKADIKAAIVEEQNLQLRMPEIHELRRLDDPDYRPLRTLEISTKQIEEAAEVLVALSKVGSETCLGREWKRRLVKPMDRETAWRGFELLERIGFVYCSQNDDPWDDGLVTMSLNIPGRYGD